MKQGKPSYEDLEQQILVLTQHVKRLELVVGQTQSQDGLLTSLVLHSPGLVYRLDAKNTSQIQFVSSKVFEITGYVEDDFLMGDT